MFSLIFFVCLSPFFKCICHTIFPFFFSRFLVPASSCRIMFHWFMRRKSQNHAYRQDADGKKLRQFSIMKFDMSAQWTQSSTAQTPTKEKENDLFFCTNIQNSYWISVMVFLWNENVGSIICFDSFSVEWKCVKRCLCSLIIGR